MGHQGVAVVLTVRYHYLALVLVFMVSILTHVHAFNISVGMLNPQSLINDGLTSDCANNNRMPECALILTHT